MARIAPTRFSEHVIYFADFAQSKVVMLPACIEPHGVQRHAMAMDQNPVPPVTISIPTKID